MKTAPPPPLPLSSSSGSATDLRPKCPNPDPIYVQGGWKPEPFGPHIRVPLCTITAQILARSLANFYGQYISGQTHEFIIYAMRQRARAGNLTVCYRKKIKWHQFFHASVLITPCLVPEGRDSIQTSRLLAKIRMNKQKRWGNTRGSNDTWLERDQISYWIPRRISAVKDNEFCHNIVKVVCRSTRLAIALWIHSYFYNVMTKFMINNRRMKNWRQFDK